MDRDTNKIRGILFALFYSILSITFLWIILLNIKTNITHYQSAFWLSLIMIAIAIVFIKKTNFSKVIIDGTRKNEFLLISVLFLISTIITIYIGLETRVEFLWDFGRVQYNAYHIAKTGNYLSTEYFARYPNNNMILLISVVIYKFLFLIFPNRDINFMYNFMIFLNCLLINLSILLTYKSMKILWNSKVSLLATLAMYLTTPILFYGQLFYTDTVGLFFISLILFLYIKSINSKNIANKLVLLSLTGVFISIGYRFKAFAIIIAVAIIIDLLMKKIHLKQKFIQLGVFIFFLIMTLSITTLIFNQSMPVTEKEKEEYQFPLAHWVMMGVNTQNDGGFSIDDYKHSLSISGYENKKKSEVSRIKQRVSDFGPSGLMKFLFVTKLSRTWANGSMMVQYYGSLGGLTDSFLQKEVYSRNGSFYNKFQNYFQIGIFIILFGIFIGSLLFNSRNINVDFVNISIFGLMLFELIWECNARYIYCFIPLFIISATNGFVTFKNLVRGGKRVKRHSKT